MKSKVDPQKVRDQNAAAAYGAYASRKGISKEWHQLDADSRDAWMIATDVIAGSLLATLDEEETFLVMLKLGMRDALLEDHMSQIVVQFVTGNVLIPTGKVRLLIAPDKISMPFAEPLKGRHDG